VGWALSVRAAKNGVFITVYVKPSSSHDLVYLLSDEIIVETKAPPSNNKANTSVIKLLSKALSVPVASISLSHGAADRVKTLFIPCLSLAEANERLSLCPTKK